MKLSIITPCYNAAEFIESAILSILSQNTEDAELIIVNDGSLDNTEFICRSYTSSHPGHPCIRYYKTENKGAGHARNYGMDKAKGEWIAFLDADDLYLDHALNERFFNMLSEYSDKKTAIIQTAKLKTDMTLSENVDILMPENLQDVKHHIPMLEFWTCIYNHDFLNTHNIRFYEYRKQDVETAFRYLAYVHADKKIAIDTSINFYLQRNNLKSNTHTWNTYHLHQIKGAIYYDLYLRTPCLEDRPFLYNIAIEQLIAYYTLCQEHGYDSKAGYRSMHTLLANIKKLPLSPDTPEMISRFRQICRWDLKASILGVKKGADSYVSPPRTSSNSPSLSNDILFERLSQISPALLSLTTLV